MHSLTGGKTDLNDSIQVQTEVSEEQSIDVPRHQFAFCVREFSSHRRFNVTPSMDSAGPTPSPRDDRRAAASMIPDGVASARTFLERSRVHRVSATFDARGMPFS